MAAKRKEDDSEQSKRFVETARALESDESGKQFEKAMDEIAHASNVGVDAKILPDQNKPRARRALPGESRTKKRGRSD